MNHSVRKAATNGEYRVIYHAHPANIIAMTFVLPLTDKDFTKALWTSATECPVVFPGGVGVVPWMVPGGADIALATSELMKKYDAAVWAHHGLFVSGPDFDITFGLMHTIEKAAETWVKFSRHRRRRALSTESFFCRARVRRVRSSSEERAQRTQMPGKRSRTQASNWRSEPRPWGLLVP